jgi:antitoxin MazE
MKVHVARWGNSAAVRLPRSVMDELGLAPGTPLELTVHGRELRLAPPPRRPGTCRDLLEELVAEARRLGPENEPEMVEWGPDVGTERIEDDAYSRGEITLADLMGDDAGGR